MDSVVSVPGTEGAGKRLSAIAIFSDLISTALEHTTSFHAPESTLGSHPLPTEILQMIFQLIFESCTHSPIDDDEDVEDDESVSWRIDDPLSPCLFPYGLACVCLRWFRILRTTPMYWTCLVIPVDAIATSLHAARIVLAWSSNFPLKVVIASPQDTSQSPELERAAVSRTMELLRPLADRIRSLSFHLEYDSSIPLLWGNHGPAPCLRKLALRSRFLQPSLGYHAQDGEEFEAPLLCELMISGHILDSSLMSYPLSNWFKNVSFLTVCGDSAFPFGNVISPPKFLEKLEAFHSLKMLMIEEIHFDETPCPTHIPHSAEILSLDRVSGGTILKELTRTAPEGSWEVVTINDCPFGQFEHSDPDLDLLFEASHLTLTFVDPNATLEDIVCRWSGVCLTVVGCPWLSRTFLDGLHEENAPSCFSCFNIIDCDFNTKDLIRMVRMREAQAMNEDEDEDEDEDDEDDDRLTKLIQLRVEGRGPRISAEQATWLAQHVEDFSWKTFAGDGLRYVWDEYEEMLRVRAAPHLWKVKDYSDSCRSVASTGQWIT